MGNFWQGPALARLIRLIHSYSSMLVLVLLVFFAITGVTLNHPQLIQSTTGKFSQQTKFALPTEFYRDNLPELEPQQTALAESIRQWLQQQHDIKAAVFNYRFEPDEMLLELDFKRPAGYATALVDFTAQQVELDAEFNGYLALLNDLHKGRNAGLSWIMLIDATAFACIIFSFTGFYLILKQPSRRSTGNSLAMLGIFISIFAYILSLH